MSSKYSTMKIAAVITLVVALLTAASHAAAHDPGLSSSVVTIDSSRIRVATSFNDKDLAFLTAPAPSLAVGIAGDRPALAGSGPTSLEAEPGHSAFGVDYRRQIDSDVRLELAIFDQLPHGHRHYVRVEDGSGNEIASRLLSADSSSFVVAGMGIARAVPTGIGSMVVLGVEHIVTGYDHLLFLLALLLPAGSAAVVVRLVTAFTVAHSLTLAASVLGFAYLPPSIVEPAIAASIVYVAARNLGAGIRSTETVALAFAFGLIHGLGFAGVLVQLGVGQGASVLAPLLAFNVGVELGQVAIVAAVVPLLHAARALPALGSRLAPAGSAAIVAMGLYWLVERIAAA